MNWRRASLHLISATCLLSVLCGGFASAPLWAQTGHVSDKIAARSHDTPPQKKAPLQVRTIGIPTKTEGKAPLKKEQPKEEEEVQAPGFIINFNDVSVGEYIRFVSQISGVNFIFNEEDLKFNVTIISEEATSPEYILSALLQILEVHGLSATEQGNQVLIYRDAQLAKLATVVSDKEAKEASGEEPAIMTRVFQVHNISPKGIEEVVKPLLSGRAVVQVSPETGHLIVTDIAGNIERVAELLETLDKPQPDVEVGEYQVQSTYIEALVELAAKILDPLGGGNITLVPQPMTDTIFIVASPYMIQRAISILEALDTAPTEPGTGAVPPLINGAHAAGPAGPSGAPLAGPAGMGAMPGSPFGPKKAQLDSTTFYIYKLQHHQGDEIKEALQDIAESLESAGNSNTDLVSTISTIQWIKASNSIVISGTRPSIEKVKELLQDLDVPLEQVFIEVLVLRTTIANSLRVGVEWGYAQSYVEGGNGTNAESALGSTQGSPNGIPSPLNQRLNPQQAPAAWPPLPEGLGMGIVGRFVSLDGKLFSSVGAFINALQADRETVIMFNPKILTQDNHTARIFVGSNVAFRESTISEPGSQILSGDIEYRDVGSELVITPILGNSDMVTLEISQSISRVEDGDGDSQSDSTNDTGSGTTTPVLKSETETRVSVPDGYFLILSGQIQETKNRTHRGLPCLGGIPIIGTAFSTKFETESKDNLIICVRPHIVRNKADMVRVTEDERMHYERTSDQRSYCLDREQTLELLNITPPRPLIHDHYWDPCYDHDPCDVVCCD